MLKRQPIKTKMTVVGSLLSIVIILLGASGFWGLYGYRDLARSISDAAEESSLSQRLTHESSTMCASFGRIAELDRRDEMIDSELFNSGRLVDQRRRFHDAMDAFEMHLEEYETRVATTPRSRGLVDEDARRDSLKKIRRAFDRMQRYQSGLLATGDFGSQTVSDLLQSLSMCCEQHSLSITSRMKRFSLEVRGSYRAWITAAWVCAGISALLIVALVFMFHKLIVTPFNHLLAGSRIYDTEQRKTDESGRRIFGPRIYLGTDDELDELAKSFNSLYERFEDAFHQSEVLARDLNQQVIDRSNEVIRNEQLASVGHLAAGVAHEINNPLQGVNWAIMSVQEDLEDATIDGETCRIPVETLEEIQVTLRRVQDQSKHCAKITRRLVDFSRNSDPEPEVIEVNQLVSDIIEMLKTVGQHKRKQVTFKPEGIVFAHCNRDHIRQVIMNLISNALQSTDPEGAVEVCLRDDQGQAVVDVIDDGCGMDEHTRTHLFEPFFTRRRDGSGTGLGLSICSRLVTQYGGTLTPFSEGPGRGSRLELRLPTGPTSDEKEDPFVDFRRKQAEHLSRADAA